MRQEPTTFEEMHLERDAILAGILHHHGPSSVKMILDSLDEFKAYVEKMRKRSDKEFQDDLQLLYQLRQDNTYDGSRLVVSSAQDVQQAMRLSELGYIALEQHTRGIIRHITRLGMKVLREELNLPITEQFNE